MIAVQVENIRAHYLAVGDLVVWDGRWRLVVAKEEAQTEDDEAKKKLKYPVTMRDAAGNTITRRIRAETALRVIAAPLVPVESEARFLLTSGGAG